MLKSEKYFFIPFAFVWVGAWLFLLIVGKIDSHLMLNNYHTTYFDIFFKHFTAVGGWVPCAVAALFLLFKKWKITIVILKKLELISFGVFVVFTNEFANTQLCTDFIYSFLAFFDIFIA